MHDISFREAIRLCRKMKHQVLFMLPFSDPTIIAYIGLSFDLLFPNAFDSVNVGVCFRLVYKTDLKSIESKRCQTYT